jgi:hypothetical protein
VRNLGHCCHLGNWEPILVAARHKTPRDLIAVNSQHAESASMLTGEAFVVRGLLVHCAHLTGYFETLLFLVGREPGGSRRVMLLFRLVLVLLERLIGSPIYDGKSGSTSDGLSLGVSEAVKQPGAPTSAPRTWFDSFILVFCWSWIETPKTYR